MTDLFGRDAKRKATRTGGAGARLLARYIDLHVERFGCSPIKTAGRDGKILKDLAKEIGEHETEELLRDFLWATDARIASGGYTVPEFKYHAARLRLLRSGHLPDTDRRTMENLDAAARASGLGRKKR